MKRGGWGYTAVGRAHVDGEDWEEGCVMSTNQGLSSCRPPREERERKGGNCLDGWSMIVCVGGEWG